MSIEIPPDIHETTLESIHNELYPGEEFTRYRYKILGLRDEIDSVITYYNENYKKII